MAVTLAPRSTTGSFTCKVTPTGADAFAQCPRGFAERYLCSPSVPPSLAMRRGAALHSTLYSGPLCQDSKTGSSKVGVSPFSVAVVGVPWPFSAPQRAR